MPEQGIAHGDIHTWQHEKKKARHHDDRVEAGGEKKGGAPSKEASQLTQRWRLAVHGPQGDAVNPYHQAREDDEESDM